MFSCTVLSNLACSRVVRCQASRVCACTSDELEPADQCADQHCASSRSCVLDQHTTTDFHCCTHHMQVVLSVTPNNGSIGGGTRVTITGSGFQRGGIVGNTEVRICFNSTIVSITLSSPLIESPKQRLAHTHTHTHTLQPDRTCRNQHTSGAGRAVMRDTFTV